MFRPRRFCMITTFYPPYHFGGDAIFVHRLVNELARRGHQVDVIHCLDSYRLLAKTEPQGGYRDHPNVRVHGLQSGFGALSPLLTQQTGQPLLKRRAIERVLDQGFDVIHYHNASLVGGPGVFALGQAVKLYTMHEYWLVCPTHVLFKDNREACVEPHCLSCALAYHRPPQAWRYSGLLERATRHIDLFLAPSRFGRDMHVQRGLTGPMALLPFFLPDAPAFSTEALPPEAREAPYFLFVGRLEKLKGLQTVIPLMRRYPQARLVVVGRGDYAPTLREMAADVKNVVFLGYQSETALAALYRHATAVVIPSLCYEVGPLVMMEAFQHGTPVVARRLGGMAEGIQDSGGGMLYTTDDELSAACETLLADPLLRHTLGQRGYAMYQREWTPDVHIERYFALIDAIAAGASPTPTLPQLPITHH